MSKGVKILEELKQEDYELWICLQGRSHMSEEQWDWLIARFEDKEKDLKLKKQENKRR